MGITYAEIKKKREDVEAAQIERSNIVYSEAEQLVEQYRKSLGLERETWTDIKGVASPYVSTGYVTGDSFRKSSLLEIDLEKDYSFDFEISTVTDDSPRGGSYSVVSIDLRLHDASGTIKVVVNNGKTFLVEEKENKYADVCEEIKLQVLSSLNDPALALTEHFNTFIPI
ncbi:hypothetical protein [Klebsiella michiganensis]|uniref:hypothetical protein n=1 Tax=Klebsiella TaxID=570 RepID=UPI001CCF6756|nr:hypothetical protein [Klebsiella michiganensis]MBZ7457318.1 hypothetical protein [Klebsiella michiganensis]